MLTGSAVSLTLSLSHLLASLDLHFMPDELVRITTLIIYLSIYFAQTTIIECDNIPAHYLRQDFFKYGPVNF